MSIQLGSAYGKVEIDSSGVTKGVNSSVTSLKSLNTKAQELGATMRRTGAIMTTAFSLPVLAAGRSAMNTFMEYEKAMNVLGAVTNATSDQMAELSGLAKELGADITLPGTSAADAAEAMAELAKAGLDVNEVMAAAKGVLQMSAAGQLGNAEAAEITANALNVFNLEGSEAVRIADLLAAAANSSSGEVRDMADALKMSASVFASAGMEIQELVTAISLMSNAGIQGSDAGTSLKQMLLSLQAPSEKAKALMKSLGINIYDANGNMKSMRDIISIFSEQMKGLTQEERNFALATIFGSDAVRAANIVLMGGVGAYDLMLGKVTEVGAASKLAAALMQGLTGSMENLKSAFETAAIAAIEPIKDDLIVLVDFAVKLLNAFANLPAPVREAIVKFVLFIAVLGPVLVLLGSLIPLLGGVTKRLNPFSGGIFGLIGTIVKLISVAAIIVKVLGVFGISTGVVGAKILALNAAIVGVGASIMSILLPILLIIGALGLLYWAFSTNFMGITDTAKQLWFIIKYYFSEGWKWLVNAVKGGAQIVLNWFKNMVQKIVQTFKSLKWSDVGKFVISGLLSGLLGGIPGVIQAAGKIAELLITTMRRKLGIASDSKEAIEAGKYVASGLIHGMEDGLAGLEADSPYQQMIEAMKDNTELMLEMSKGFLSDYYEGIDVTQKSYYERQTKYLEQYAENMKKYYEFIAKMNASVGWIGKLPLKSINNNVSGAVGAITGINTGFGLGNNANNSSQFLEQYTGVPVEEYTGVPVEEVKKTTVNQYFSSGLTIKDAEKMMDSKLSSFVRQFDSALGGA